MPKSGFYQNGLEISYEIGINGYDIFWGDEEWPRLSQREPEIPYPWLGYEENAKIQIQQLCGLEPEIPKAEKDEPWTRIEKILIEDIKMAEKKTAEMGRAGAMVMQLAASAGAEAAQEVAAFTAYYPAWIADGGTEEPNHITEHNGTAYICINPIQRLAHWAPDAAANNYCPYPAADGEGVYPYLSGMLVWGGMRVRGGDGEIYRCTLAEGTYKLVNEPKDAAGIFEVDLPFS